MSRVDKKKTVESSQSSVETAHQQDKPASVVAMAIPEEIQSYMRGLVANGVKSVAPDTLRCLEPYGWNGATQDAELKPWIEALLG